MNFYERAKELADNCLTVKGNNVYETLAKEFNISKRTAGDRFKSIFKKPVRDYIRDNTIPSKEEMVDLIIKYDNSTEAFNNSKVRYSSLWAKYLQMYFGSSNFFRIKNTLTYKKPIKELTPTREDNESILISQILGDGYVERKNSLKIDHGEKQYEYLKFKISLLNNAYPKTNGFEHIRKRIHISKVSGKELISYSYRTGEVLKYPLDKLLAKTLEEQVFSLTPLGMLLYYLDDGSFVQTKTEGYMYQSISISSVNENLLEYVQKYLYSYGIETVIEYPKLIIRKKQEIIKFLQNFALPFKNIIPESMMYKIDYKDIVEM